MIRPISLLMTYRHIGGFYISGLKLIIFPLCEKSKTPLLFFYWKVYIIHKIALSEVSINQLVSVAEQVGLSVPEDRCFRAEVIPDEMRMLHNSYTMYVEIIHEL